MAKLHVHLKAGHGRTELRNGSIQIVAEPGETVEVDAKQYRLAMYSKIFANGPFRSKKPAAATNKGGSSGKASKVSPTLEVPAQ
jgi:hypothetical protein